MKASEILHLTLEENGYNEFVTKGSGFSRTIEEAMERYAIGYHELKVKKSSNPTSIIHFSFSEREPEIGAHVSLVWSDGSDCECTYSGLDKSILPLPTHWYYVR